MPFIFGEPLNADPRVDAEALAVAASPFHDRALYRQCASPSSETTFPLTFSQSYYYLPTILPINLPGQ
jgi:hypothetical protein